MPQETKKIPWNKGLKGVQSHSPETRNKIRRAMLGRATPWLTGKTMKEETKRKISISATGLKRPWVKGHPKGWRHREETKKKLSGPNNHLWKGGITPINLLIRNSYEYKRWRRAVFERDNFTCVECGIRGGVLNADHIKPFAHFPELRFSLENGRTLCVPCHRKTPTFAIRTNYFSTHE